MSGIFVPVIDCGESTLFKVSSTESDDFLINGILPHNEDNDEDSAKITSVVEKIEKVFGKNVEDIPQQLSIINKDDPDIELQFDDSTQSITLGLISELHREENHLTFKSQWDYAVVTGDVAENFRLERVEFIEKKFEAVKVLAAKEPDKKIIFLYINDDLPIPRGYDKNFPNIYVAQFTSDTKIEYIYAELFVPKFDEKQQELLRKATNLNEKKFYETKTFIELKSEIDKFNGFFIKGKSNSGKSILANALVLYAMEIELAYAPLWVSINNVEIQNILTARNKNQNLYEYFQKQIKSEKNEPQKKYILVIDNLEVNSNYINDILCSVHEILQKDDSIIFTIITSWQNPSHTELFCKGKVNFKAVSLSDTAKEDFYGIYKTIYDIYYSNYLQKATVEEQYELRGQSYKWLKDRPGNIPFIFNYLDKKPVKELIEYLEMTDPSEAEWNEKFIGMSFDQLGLFAKIVLFVFTRDFGCKNEKCSAKSDYEKIKAVIQREGIIEGDFITRESIHDAFSEILSHYLLQENAEGAFYIKNDVLQYLLFNNDAKTSKLNEHFINENEKIQATILYNWTEKIKDLINEQNTNYVLFEIAKYANNPELFDKCLDGEIDLNRKNQDGLTLLHVAVKQNPNLEIIKYLIDKGADWKLLTDDENTLIHLAVENPNVEVLRYLLEQNLFEEVDSKNSLGLTPYDRAAGVAENMQVFELLEKYGHELSEETFQQALSGAAENNPNVDIFKYFITKGAKTDAIDLNGATLLHHAAINPSISVVRYILEQHFYVDINKENSEGVTPLCYAAVKNPNPKVLDLLIENGADWHIVPENSSLLSLSVIQNTKEVVSYIIEKHIFDNINKQDDEGYTALLYALENNPDLSVSKLLIENGATFVYEYEELNDCSMHADGRLKLGDIRTNRGLTSLHCAAKNKNPELLKYVLDKHLFEDINARTIDGITPLMITVFTNKSLEIFRLMTETYYADKNVRDYEMNNLLHFAIAFGNEEVAKDLIYETEGYRLEKKDFENVFLMPFIRLASHFKSKTGEKARDFLKSYYKTFSIKIDEKTKDLIKQHCPDLSSLL